MAEENKISTEQKDVKQNKETGIEKLIPEWLTPILGALGSMGGSYMIWIKPLQERLDLLSMQVKELQKQIDELQEENEELREELEDLQRGQEYTDDDFTDNRLIPSKTSIRRKRIIRKRI